MVVVNEVVEKNWALEPPLAVKRCSDPSGYRNLKTIPDITFKYPNSADGRTQVFRLLSRK